MTDTPTLREARKAAGLSIRDFEKRTGINRGLLSVYERGIPADHQKRIDRALRLAAIERATRS